MKTALKAQLGQQLNLTPQLLQSIRLLQLDALQLEQEVSHALEANPLLEREDAGAEEAAEGAQDDAVEIDEGPAEYDWGQASGGAGGGEYDEDAVSRLAAGESTDLRQRMLSVYALECRDRGELAIAAFLLDRVDDSGYLEMAQDALAAEAEAELGIVAGELEAVRQRLMRCEPVGVGARDLRECLRVQLDELPGQVPGRSLARRLIDQHLDLLALHDVVKLAKALDVEPEQAVDAERLVLTLNPRPGAEIASTAAIVIPDVVVSRGPRGWQVSLNPATAPKIRVNPLYERLLGDSDDPAAKQMRDLLNEARWLTRGLSMRYDTLLRATRAIVARQQAFLEQGDEAMVPLTLREVADEIQMHESTVSRITTGKYVQTPRGTYELKYFFAVRLDGASVAGVAVKAMVKKLIDAENPEAPLADDTIAVLLARQGVRIARRTVAKYRDQLRIPSAKERKRPGGPGLQYAGRG